MSSLSECPHCHVLAEDVYAQGCENCIPELARTFWTATNANTRTVPLDVALAQARESLGLD